jgi:hydroxyacylglutathione hydrolase
MKGKVMFKIKTINHAQMDMNSYLLIKKNDVVIVDPGFNGKTILDRVKESGYHIQAILLTHGHYDHIRDVEMLYKKDTCKVYIHKDDYKALYNSNINYSKTFGSSFVLNKEIAITLLNDNEKINILNETIKVIHTPGHTFGSVMYEYNKYIFSGDTIFYDSIGRTDLFSGNFNAIRKSINMIKENLSNNKQILPGHGKSGSFQKIKQNNRYLQ